MKKILKFINNIKVELSKVTWIPKKKLFKLTLIVLSVSIIMGLALQLTDISLQYIINNYL